MWYFNTIALPKIRLLRHHSCTWIICNCDYICGKAFLIKLFGGNIVTTQHWRRWYYIVLRICFYGLRRVMTHKDDVLLQASFVCKHQHMYPIKSAQVFLIRPLAHACICHILNKVDVFDMSFHSLGIWKKY